jgi:hypothetical protein
MSGAFAPTVTGKVGAVLGFVSAPLVGHVPTCGSGFAGTARHGFVRLVSVLKKRGLKNEKLKNRKQADI